MTDEPKKPGLDERLEAVVESLELMRLEMEQYRASQILQDGRERRARLAILAGIRAYLEALNGEPEGE